MPGGRLINNHIKTTFSNNKAGHSKSIEGILVLFIERHSDVGNCCRKGACIAYNDQTEKLAVSAHRHTDITNSLLGVLKQM